MPLHRNYDYVEIVPASAFAQRNAPMNATFSYHHQNGNYTPIGVREPSPYLNRTLLIPTTPSSCAMSYRLNMTIHDPQSFSPESTPTFYTLDERKSKKHHRVSRALRELLGRSSSSRKDKSANPLNSSFRSESPRKRRQVPSSAILSRSIVHYPAEMDVNRSVSVYDIDNPRQYGRNPVSEFDYAPRKCGVEFVNIDKEEASSSTTSGGSFYETMNPRRRDMNRNYPNYHHSRAPSADPSWFYAATMEKDRRKKMNGPTTPVRVESFALPEPKSIEIRNIRDRKKNKGKNRRFLLKKIGCVRQQPRMDPEPNDQRAKIDVNTTLITRNF
ncbi:hypothetical protein WR25_15613 [Diploscapter pachys]|uniref:Uncharacterized protein n=1 Tax=Diploscapter pachys TaxID=2018661 RepID=A0A2A2M0A3_9BILA|nr:hypothetical protein WR25_15613 [Diploscapter pachys]